MRGTYKVTLEHKPTADFLNKNFGMRKWIFNISLALFSQPKIKGIVEAMSTGNRAL